ncbi:MAG TPA: hypothetical protein VH475_20965 [Tepidisphaeraceae bacterium]
MLESRRLLSSSFDGGTGNAFAIASDGTLYLAYYKYVDATHGDLRYAIRNTDGTWRDTSADGGIIDNSSSQIGLYVSMALDSTGKPGVAYFDGVNSKLRYAHFNGTSWDERLVTNNAGKRGNYPSLAFQADKPTISHFVKTNGGGFLEIDQAPNPSPSAGDWSATAIDASGNAGRYSSLAYNANTSKWGISYDDSGTSIGARYVQSSSSSVTTGWGTAEVIPQLSSGTSRCNAVWTSLVYDAQNRPAFAFYDNATAAVIFSHRNGSISAPWNSIFVDTHNTTGKYPTLMFTGGQFRLSYYDESNDRVEVQQGGDTSGGWTFDDNLISGGGSELKVVLRNGVNTFAWSDDGALYLTDDQEGSDWTQLTPANSYYNYGGRRQHTSLVFDPQYSTDPGAKMWIIGGFGDGVTGASNIVDYSDDGTVWHRARQNGDPNGFTPRIALGSTVFDGKAWVVGGQGLTATMTDAWYSSDMINWTQATDGSGAAVNLGPRRGTAAVTFNGKLFVIGGTDGSATNYPANTVMYSADGVNWSGVNPLGLQRRDAITLVFNGAIYVIGGTPGGGGSSHTFKTHDATGTTWDDLGAPGVTFGNAHGTVYDGRMWIADGSNLYWSTDGITWTMAPHPATSEPLSGRTEFTMITMSLDGSDKMIILGGWNPSGSLWKDDAWATG